MGGGEGRGEGEVLADKTRVLKEVFPYLMEQYLDVSRRRHIRNVKFIFGDLRS